jgi:ribosomal protein L13E
MSYKRQREHFCPDSSQDSNLFLGSCGSRFPGGWNNFQRLGGRYDNLNTDSSAATSLSASTNHPQHSALWEPADCWKRIKYFNKLACDSVYQSRHLNFPFELQEIDYLRRIFCILSENLAYKLGNLLSQCCPWVYVSQGGLLQDEIDCNDFFLLLRFFIQELQTDYQQYSRRNELYEVLITFPFVSIDLLLQKCLYLYGQRGFLLFSSRKLLSLDNPLQFELPEIFNVAREVIQQFELINIGEGREIEGFLSYDPLEELVDLEEQYFNHKDFKERRVHAMGWHDGGTDYEAVTYNDDDAHDNIIATNSGKYEEGKEPEPTSNYSTRLAAYGFTSSKSAMIPMSTYSTVGLRNVNSSAVSSPSVLPPSTYQSGAFPKNSPSELLKMGKSVRELRHHAVTASQLKQCKINAVDLLQAGYSVNELREGGYGTKELRSLGTSCADLKKGGYNASQLLSAGFSVRDLGAARFSVHQLKEAGVALKELREKGHFSVQQLRAGGCVLKDLIEAGFVVGQLRSAQFSPKELLEEGGLTLVQLRQGGYDAISLKSLVHSAKELKEIGFTAGHGREAGYSVEELKEAGYTAAQLKGTAKFTPEELKKAGCSVVDMKMAGISGFQLKELGFKASELRDQGNYTVHQLKSFGYNPAEMMEAGFSLQQIRDVGFTTDEIRDSVHNSGR